MTTLQNLSAALFAVIAFLAVPAAAQAQDTDGWGTTCRYQWDMSSVLRERSDEDRRRFGGGLHYCIHKDGSLAATVLEPVRDDGVGGCYFASWNAAVEGDEKQGFVVPKKARVAEYYPGSSVQMQPKPKSGACPRQDDKGYIPNDGVPDSIFLQILAMWKQAVADPAHLGGLFASRSDAKHLKDFLVDLRKEKLAVRIGSVSTSDGYILMGVRDSGAAVPLELRVSEDTGDVPSGGLIIAVAVRNGRLKFGTAIDYKS